MNNTGTAFAITTSNTVLLPKVTKALYVGVTGDVKVDFCNKIGMGRVIAVDGTGAIVTIQVEYQGIGYNSAPTATVVDTNTSLSTGTGASLTVTVGNGIVTGFTINSGGTGYHVNDEITLAGGFTGVVLKNLLQGIIHNLQVTKVYATGTTATDIVGLY